MVLRDIGVWVRTSSAISYFDGNSFTTYNTNSGLIHDNINDFTVDYNNNLWIASNKGISKFDGTTFTDWRGKFAFSLEVDSSNNVYALRLPAIDTLTSSGSFNYLEYYDGTNWIVDTLSNAPKEKINQAKLERMSNGLIAITGDGGNYITTIQFPFTIKQVELKAANASYFLPIIDIEIDLDGNYWVLTSNPGNNVYRLINDEFEPIMPTVGRIPSNLSYNSGIFGFAGNEGAYVHSGIPTLPKIEESISINNIFVSTKIDNNIFDASSTSNAFKFPKDFSSSAIYQANFIVTTKNPNTQNIQFF